MRSEARNAHSHGQMKDGGSTVFQGPTTAYWFGARSCSAASLPCAALPVIPVHVARWLGSLRIIVLEW